MVRAHVSLVTVLAVAVGLLAGCSAARSSEVAEVAPVAEAAASSETVARSSTHASWEEAAIAEAQRLHPGLRAPTAERVDLTTLGEHVVVRTDSGFCAVYGGMAVEGRWQADEVMVLDAYCGDGQ